MRFRNTIGTRASFILAGAIVALSTTMIACANGEAATGKTGRNDHAFIRPTDETITTWVDANLQVDPRVSLSEVEVKTTDGIVTLRGTVDSVEARRFAKMEAKKIDGVRGVIDEMVVRASDRSDSKIKDDVVRRLSHASGVRCGDLAVGVAAGVVTLHGHVASWNEREYAATLAGEVRGVRDVANEMELSFLEPRTDDQNRDEIVAALDRDPYLTGLPITVKVSDEVATLEGSVGNAYEKSRAEEDALRVASVERVSNRLAVDWLEARGVRDERPAMTDEQIERAVRAALDQDMRIMHPSNIVVETSDHQVTLTGEAPDLYQETVARRDAYDAVGARQVVDLLRIDTSKSTDDAIAGELKLGLSTDYLLSDRDIRAAVKNGVATLTGDVRSSFESEHATDVATSVLGVREVVNDLIVRPAVGYSDQALKDRIQDRLRTNWKTRRVASAIHVTVEDGAVTLTGSVDSWSERLEAARQTRLVDGVAEVNNDLTLTDLASVAGRLDDVK